MMIGFTACGPCSKPEISDRSLPSAKEQSQAANQGLKLVADATKSPDKIPQLLSQTGIFTDVLLLQIAPEFMSYDLNLPFWSDSAYKSRWLYVPSGKKIKFSQSDYWSFPVGSVFVKHFELNLNEGSNQPLYRLETRVLMHGENGWVAYAYKWNKGQTDAVLSLSWVSEDFSVKKADGTIKKITWAVPGREECFSCHGLLEPKILGAQTAQFNKVIDQNGNNQLAIMQEKGMFDQKLPELDKLPKFAAINDQSIPLHSRARAYLAVNCSSCHYKGGMADFDLSSTADFSQVIGKNPDPDEEDLVVDGGKLILPGKKEKSLVWLRMLRTDFHRMPPISSEVIDEQGVDLIGKWIDSGAL